jgi:hypothetical protein
LIVKIYRLGKIKEKDDKKKETEKDDKKNENTIKKKYKRLYGVCIFDLNPSVIHSLLSEEAITSSLTCYTSKTEDLLSKLHESNTF